MGFALAAAFTLITGFNCIAADNAITIDSVEFEEYSNIYGQRDKHTVLTRVKYTVSEDTERVSLAFLGKNTKDPKEFEKNVIYLDQIDKPDGEFEFLIERSRIEKVLGTSDIEEKTLYLKMGTSDSDTPDVKEITYKTPSCMIFEGAQIRTSGKQGLRFIFSIPRSVYGMLEHPSVTSDTELGFGSIVIPKKYLGENELVKGFENEVDGSIKKAKTVPAVKLFDITDDHVYFTVCIIKMDESHYTEEYTAVPYITYSENGKTVTEYGAKTTNVSVFSVAEMYYSDLNTTDEVKTYLYDNILSVVDPIKYPEK